MQIFDTLVPISLIRNWFNSDTNAYKYKYRLGVVLSDDSRGMLIPVNGLSTIEVKLDGKKILSLERCNGCGADELNLNACCKYCGKNRAND